MTASTAAPEYRLPRPALYLLLRAGRITKYLPTWKGVNRLLRWYRRIVPEDFTMRLKDFDGDLILDVNVRHNTDLSLWHYPRLYEKEQREAFCSAVTPGCTVLDVGANIGLYTLLAAKRGARVFAVEPDPRNAAVLRHHVEINGFGGRVTVLELAATEQDRRIPLYRHRYNLGESNIIGTGERVETIEGRALDSLGLPPIDICKMDIEGAELMALLGMKQTLERSPRMKLFVEYAEQFGNSRALLEFLRSHFSSLQVLEATDKEGEIPPFCNILATH